MWKRSKGISWVDVFLLRKINKFVKAEIEQHRQNLDHKNPRDYIDCYLNELQMTDHSDLSELGLEMSIMDLFQAGTETTSTTLRWAILYMVNNPNIQKKVQQEIDDVLGFDRLPQYEDRMRMPYCEATVLEVQEWQPLHQLVCNIVQRKTRC
ncbi:cytochrome P450 2C25-like [Ciona intestinalis]